MSMSVTQVSIWVTVWFRISMWHCTSSVFLLVSFPFLQAIKIFSDARPPGIYKPEYIDSLYKFYHEKKPETIVCPATPEWKRAPELVDLNGEAAPDNDDDDDDGVPGPPLQVWIL